ncbi:MAG: tRNA (adenosine(37)-N6)-threonylcarbamoyltransferase complex ATPase subunit type 1 TsaE, partial [Nitratireductor sp.]|nr:tRNA (adenosine(37)-N6)-threonylcarbamoyltransferase complex ATPase subunit type 1 TsaE [Nitratireductor sp.]
MASASEDGTRQLGRDIAMALSRGVIHLKGDLGSGKSVLARAMIRQLCEDDALEVPSPTFSLVQSYAAAARHGGGEIVHADLYRIGDPSECGELGLASPEPDALVIVEWPENGAGELMPADVEIAIAEQTEDRPECRSIEISGKEEAVAAIARSLAIRTFLDTRWEKGVRRSKLQGDASTRSYETVTAGGEARILMNAPRQADGPAIRDGKPYSQIAHLAEDVSAFAGVAAILEEAGLAVPRLYACDLTDGLILLENLGSGLIIDENRVPIRARYLSSAGVLAAFHQNPVVTEHWLENGAIHRVPSYDRGALMIEAELLLDWYLPRFRGQPATPSERDDFLVIWNALIDLLENSEKRLCMRDFHSPNIIWCAERQDTDRVGLIDFQDAVIGPSA